MAKLDCASKKDKIVTIHKIFDAPCLLLFFMHSVNKNVILAKLIAWS